MSDSKYGRLFTEADVEKMLAYCMHEGELDNIVQELEKGRGCVARGHGPHEPYSMTFGDESLFLVRPSDKRSPEGLGEWLREHQGT